VRVAAFRSRFTFADDGIRHRRLHPRKSAGREGNLINGPSVDTSGLDFQGSYFGLTRCSARPDSQRRRHYTIEYKRGACDARRVHHRAALDRAGKTELLSAFYSTPVASERLLEWTSGPHTALDDHFKQGTDNLVGASI